MRVDDVVQVPPPGGTTGNGTAYTRGGWLKRLGGIGDALTEGMDALEYATEPWCWGGNSNCGVNDDYKKFTEKHGVDDNTKNYDAGKDFTEAASMFNIGGWARAFMKNLFKKAAKKNIPKPKVPEVKMIDGWMPETVLDKIPDGFGPMKPTKKGVGYRLPGPKQDGIRIDKGNLNNSQEFQQVDHVVINSGGRIIGRDGKPVKGAIDLNEHNSYMAHIPLEDWLKWEKWNTPTG
ncbi:hypothetical protein [Streptomyces sp. 1222.5]|uniref:hypothetical protein n=1 Tax=Streptomyces sp. 1222.5 TaxID=1881026 RepID=UPI003D726377